jgi:hypothetical protein
MPLLKTDLLRARSLWFQKQELADSSGGKPAEVVARSGWVRTLGGIDVYLAVRARCPELTRDQLDSAVDRGELRVIPAARGCIYLVPAADVPLCLELAAELSGPRNEREMAKVGLKQKELDDLAAAVVELLGKKGSLATTAIRAALPPKAVRNLGEAGKKIGLSSPLPLALRQLEFSGRIERTLEGGRLDTERYLWRKVTRQAKPKGGRAHGGALRYVLERFLAFAGPATAKEASAWIGVSQRDITAALEKIKVVEIEVEGRGCSWLLERDVDALEKTRRAAASIALLPFEDNIITWHGGPGVHTDPEHRARPVAAWGSSKPTTLGDARHVHQRPFFCADRLAGFWEYDASRSEVVAADFAPLPAAAKKALQARCASTAAFIRDELGHARSFSLDSDDAVLARAKAVRAMLK